MEHVRILIAALLLAAVPGSAPAQPKADRSGLQPDDTGGEVAAARPKGRRVAFLVGVGAFKHDLPDLGGSPQKDVTKLSEVLKEGGFEVVTLTDAQATRAEVEKRFAVVVGGGGDAAKALGKADLLLVAACTHGFSLPPVPGAPDVPYLAAHDSKLDRPDTMVGLNALIDAGKSSGATVLFLLDACRELPPDKNRGATRGFEPTRAVLPVGTAVLFGCGRGQVSHQSDRAGGHGLFTYAVLKTLRGETGLAGEVSWTELVAAVQRTFRTSEFQNLIPPTRPQTPFAAGGELPYVDLLRIIGRFEEDLRSCGGTPGLAGDRKRAEYLRGMAPTRLVLWREAAKRGDAATQILCGHCYRIGTGVPKDDAEAVRWYRTAAEAGSTVGMFNLALMYEAGRGVPIDEPEAGKWFRQAADAGNLSSMIFLGQMYAQGRGQGAGRTQT